MVRALDRKLMRDLLRLWGQALTIALVVACGIASFVAMRSAFDSLLLARDRYYEDRRFADVFASLERAPEEIARRIEDVPGVARVHTRVVEDVMLPLPDLAEPATGRIVSVPGDEESPLNAVHLRKGRMPEPGRADEVLVLEAFAQAHRLEPGATLPAVINGTLRDLRVVGLALSPEYVFAVGGNSFVADDRRFAVVWMDRRVLAPAFRMEGCFDDVVLAVQPGANERAVIEDVRRILAPYGVLTVVGRDRQLSNHVLDGELGQLRAFALVTPVIFLGVAAFLVNVVLARTLHLQRGQIATLKAIGYTNREIALHYIELVTAIVATGAVFGIALGDLLGRGMIGLYRPYFRFATLEHHLPLATALTGVLVSVAAGVGGALGSVLEAARLPPAEAMQPESPVVYRRSLLERLGLQRLLGTAARMVQRELARRPLRALLSCFGIAWATAVVIGARFTYDAMDLMLDLQFEGAQREDVEVTFRRALPDRVVHELAQLPGVVEVQGQRAVVVRLRSLQRYRETALVGYAAAPVPLRSVAQWPRHRFDVPAEGIVLSEKLADVLGVEVGGHVQLEVLEGDRRLRDVTVSGVVPDVFGLFAYGGLPAVQRLLGEEGNVSSVLVRVEPDREDAFVERLKTMPQVASVTRRRELLAQFNKQAEHVWVTTGVLTLFGAIIALGVVYNHARIALSMRSRDLASLRVLGFTRAEVSAMLLGELAVYVVVGVPLGLLLGPLIVRLVTGTVDPETYRFPAYVSARTYAFAVIVTVLAALASALVVRRKVDHLDLVGVLKTRE